MSTCGSSHDLRSPRREHRLEQAGIGSVPVLGADAFGLWVCRLCHCRLRCRRRGWRRTERICSDQALTFERGWWKMHLLLVVFRAFRRDRVRSPVMIVFLVCTATIMVLLDAESTESAAYINNFLPGLVGLRIFETLSYCYLPIRLGFQCHATDRVAIKVSNAYNCNKGASWLRSHMYLRGLYVNLIT